MYATEAQGPSVTPVADAGSLWDQTSHWIWNPPGDAWPLPVAAADPSGICSLGVQVGTAPAIGDSLPSQDDSSWQECQQPASWTAAVDTTTPGYVNSQGQMPVTLQATNAAELSNAPTSETLNVDDQQPSVSLSTPDDPNPTVWVNHAVTVDATASTGPSLLGGMNCGVNSTAAQSYPAGGLTVDGDGVKTVSCTAWNNAVDPQGQHNVGTSSVTVHIDEAPPVVSLEPANPNDPTGVVADASDSESGVAGGSIDMAPAGTGSWTALPTTFTGSQLVAHFDDAGVRGPYAFRVSSCDNVGNCASTSRTVMLPVRTQAVSEVSLEQVPAARCTSGSVELDAATLPARSRRERASEARLAGDSGVSLASGGLVRPHVSADPAPTAAGRIVAGGASGSIAQSLSQPKRQARIARATVRHHKKPHTTCSTSAGRLAARARVAFGRPVRLHGLLMSSAGVPLAGQPVAILTAPDNGSNAFTEATAVTTAPNGRWTATLPPGSSRVIEASYPGSPTILPASGYATVITPAKIEITHVTPDRTPWGGRVRITGRVLGGYIPASSKLLRLDLGIVGIPGLSKIQGIPNVSPDGTFTTTYKFARYQGVVRFWLQVSSLAEADFPFAPARSRRVIVTVGVPAPTAAHRKAAAYHRRRSRFEHGRRSRFKHGRRSRSSMAAENTYRALRQMGDLGRELERRRPPDPYPRPSGAAPSLEDLRLHRDEITQVATRHGARTLRVFGSVARGEAGRCSDVDILVDMGDQRSLFQQAALQGARMPSTCRDHRGIAARTEAHPGADRARSGSALSPRRDIDRLADTRAALADIRNLTEAGKAAFEGDRVAQQAVAYNEIANETTRRLSRGWA